jgi:hypothetical protein
MLASQWLAVLRIRGRIEFNRNHRQANMELLLEIVQIYLRNFPGRNQPQVQNL